MLVENKKTQIIMLFFPRLSVPRQAGKLQTNSRQETFICMLSNLEKNTNEGYKGIVGVCKKSWELSLIVRRGGGGRSRWGCPTHH